MTAGDGERPGTPSVPWFLRSRPPLVATLVVTIALPISLLALVVAGQARQWLRAQAVAQNVAAARFVAEAAHRHFTGLTLYVESFARRLDLRRALERTEGDGVVAHLRDLVVQNRGTDRTFVTDPGGILRYDYPHASEVRARSFAFRDWYAGVTQAGRTYVSEVYRQAALPRVERVTIATPLWDDRQRTLGYLAAQPTIAGLSEWLARVKPSATGAVALIDHRGTLATREGRPARPCDESRPNKPVGDGTGLGLALCRSMIEGHGGALRVESSPGQGATLVVELPVQAPPDVRAPAPAETPRVRGKTILVVDDEPDVANLLAELLAVDGHRVDTVTDGARSATTSC